MAPEVPDVEIPDWVTEINGDQLQRLLAVSGTLITIARDPLDWFETNIAERLLGGLVSGLLYIGGLFGSGLYGAFSQLAEIPGLVASPFTDAGSELALAGVSLFNTFGSTLEEVTTAAGPLAPVVTALLWLVMLAMLIQVLRRAGDLAKVATQVIPWL